MRNKRFIKRLKLVYLFINRLISDIYKKIKLKLSAILINAFKIYIYRRYFIFRI